jgi:predicted DNA-binding ribbon-helix-helix protein
LGVTRTIRLEDDLDEVLQKIAKDEKVTVNSIVNRSVRRYADWDRHAERFGMMAVRPVMLVGLMERQSLDEARELGKLAAKESLRPAVEYIFVEFSLVNVLEFLRRFATYGGRYDFEDSVEGRKHVILMRHSLGPRWSAYYEGMLKEIFDAELGIKIRVSVSPEVVIGRFELSG